MSTSESTLRKPQPSCQWSTKPIFSESKPRNIHTYIHMLPYTGKRVSLVRGQLSVPSRCTAVYTWLSTAGVTSGRGNPALLSWVDPVLGNFGLPSMVGLGSTGTVRCWQTCPMLAKFDRQAWEWVVALCLS